MNTAITKADLRRALGFDTDAQLADFYGISASAVSLWKEDGPVPELRRLQAVQRRPEAFQHAAGQGSQDAAHAAGVV